MQTPWAILLIKFNDNAGETHNKAYHERLFTTAGAGTLNMVAFFDEMSHGRIDVSGSQVFGWYTLGKASTDYTGSGADPEGRRELVRWAKEAAKDDVDFSKFFGVVVCLNIDADLFGGMVDGYPSAVSGPTGMTPSDMGQEMGHGYGLDHSRLDGTLNDYTDPYDIMSTRNTNFMATDPNYTLVGPGLNAWNMRGRSWLLEHRVWSAWRQGADATIVLRPLHRRDLAGYLAAEIGEYLVEFRVPDRWDANIGFPFANVPVVLVHRFEDNQSYLMSGTGGQQGLQPGSRFEVGNVDADPTVAYFTSALGVDVLAVDPVGLTATIRLRYRTPQAQDDAIHGRPLFGVDVGGGGLIVVGGKVVPVPPHSPLVRVLEQIAVLHGASSLPDIQVQQAVRMAAVKEMSRLLAMEEAAIDLPLQHRTFEGLNRHAASDSTAERVALNQEAEA
jgi:hypothetical protein